jgi:glycine cleavage system regulatory protein
VCWESDFISELLSHTVCVGTTPPTLTRTVARAIKANPCEKAISGDEFIDDLYAFAVLRSSSHHALAHSIDPGAT